MNRQCLWKLVIVLNSDQIERREIGEMSMVVLLLLDMPDVPIQL